ncbi:MAG: MFS transporter [Bryobacteraceae bacterium]
MLTAVSIFAFIDRQILSLLVQPIRRDLNISETQMSLIIGFSFAIFFTLFAIPIGRLADRYPRRFILASGLAGWSLSTAACGLARSFSQMMLFRMGVGMGEASLSPCAYSLISDSFPTARRSTALSVFSMGIYLGSGIALLAGGLVVQYASARQSTTLPILGAVHPWQLVLIVLGLAGLSVIPLLLTLDEPLRRTQSKQPGLADLAAYMRLHRTTLTRHYLGFACITLAATAGAAWIPEMFRRNFHWSIPKFGVIFGIEVAIFGCLGAFTAGRIADRLLRRGALDANLRVAVWIAALAMPVNTLLFLAPSGEWAMVWLGFGAALTAAPYGVAAGALQQILPGHLRAQMTGTYILVVNLIGSATGPTFTALLTQHVFRRDTAVNYSLLIVHLAAFTSALILLQSAKRPFLASLERPHRP